MLSWTSKHVVAAQLCIWILFWDLAYFLYLSAAYSHRTRDGKRWLVHLNTTQNQTDTLPHSLTTVLVKNNDKELWATDSLSRYWCTQWLHAQSHRHTLTNTALVVAEVFRVCVLTWSRLWRSLCCTINWLCTRVTSPTTSSVSVCVSSPLWLSYSRSKWSTEEQAGLKRKIAVEHI